MLERGRDSIEEEEKVEQLPVPADGLEGEQQAEYYIGKGGGGTWKRMLRSMSSCLPGRCCSFMLRLSFLASLAAKRSDKIAFFNKTKQHFINLKQNKYR